MAKSNDEIKNGNGGTSGPNHTLNRGHMGSVIDALKDWYTTNVLPESEFTIELAKVKEQEALRLRMEEEAFEIVQIISRAKKNGTYLKAPNGKPTNLTERQWVLVRTKMFKEKLGDWERATQVSKLLKSESVVATGEEWKGKYELRSGSATDYILNFLRFDKDGERIEYTNTDTGSVIIVSGSASEVTSHGSNTHLKTVALIPQIIRESVFLGEEANKKNKRGFTSFRYYATGLKLGDVDYTVRLTTCVGDDEIYYDHSLTEIKKEELADRSDLITNQASDRRCPPSATKDRRLISLLQVDFSRFSNIVDENGEPKSFKVDALDDGDVNIRHQQVRWIKRNSEVCGWFNPATCKSVLHKGYTTDTILEAFWHATIHLAKMIAPRFRNKMLAYAQNATKNVKRGVKKQYCEFERPEVRLEKVGAEIFVIEYASEIEKLSKKTSGIESLFANAWWALLCAIGENKASFGRLAKFLPDEVMRALAKAFASGKHPA